MTRIPESAAPRTDWRKLDSLMEESDLDLLIVNSKHNIQYLLNGYRFFFFDAMDAIGISRYLPILVYPRGRPDRAAYIGNAMESYEKDLGRLPLATVITSAWGTQDAMREAIAHIETLDRSPRRIGIEAAFLPADAYTLLTSRMSDAIFVDALVPLERLRARKTADELQFLRRASEGVAASMLAVIASHGAGATKRDLALAMKRESQTRDLSFDYCLVTTGASLNRAPSDQIWRSGEIASLDSGANLNGYIGDLCRMAIAGEPDGELQDLLGEIEAIQQAARRAIRPGALGGDAIAAGDALVRRSVHRSHLSFVAHGMGLVAHEAPRLMDRGVVPYPAPDAALPLEEAMVISIETTLLHPTRGFIKLEDTVAVTASGCEGFGDSGRGWNRAGGSGA